MDLLKIRQDVQRVMEQYIDSMKSIENPVHFFVLGCSTSRVQGEKIGSQSHEEIGLAIVEQIFDFLNDRDIYLGVQCCEHLNRSVVMDYQFAKEQGYTIVNARPVLSAGGAAATAAYKIFDNPVLVESVQADGGLDIGQTGIGMHINAVQIPKHFDQFKVGKANVLGMASRPKLIGGPRAQY